VLLHRNPFHFTMASNGCPLPGRPQNAPTSFVASDHAFDGKKHLLLAASGSVATIKLPNMAQALSVHQGLSIRIIVTKSAEKFLVGQSAEQPTLESLLQFPNVDAIYQDEDEWKSPWVRGGAILHIELRRWAHLLVVAPLSANTMAKITNGIADNLLSSVVRAWDTTGEIDNQVGKKRIVLAAAMNTAMWRHPVTKKQIDILENEWGVNGAQDGWVELLRPIGKTLACGDTGDGAMRDWYEIVSVIEARLSLNV